MGLQCGVVFYSRRYETSKRCGEVVWVVQDGPSSNVIRLGSNHVQSVLLAHGVEVLPAAHLESADESAVEVGITTDDGGIGLVLVVCTGNTSGTACVMLATDDSGERMKKKKRISLPVSSGTVGLYSPPMLQVPATGSPDMATERTARKRDKSGDMPKASPRPVIVSAMLTTPERGRYLNKSHHVRRRKGRSRGQTYA